MSRNSIRVLLDLLLLASVVVVVLTGVIVEQLDLHEFRLHPLSGYVMTGLVAVHVFLHRGSILRFVGGRLHRRVVGVAPRPEEPVVADSTGPVDRIDVESAAGEHGSDPRPVAPVGRRVGGSRRSLLAASAAGLAGVTAGWFARSEVSPEPYDGGDVGLFYHRESSLGVRGLLSNFLDWGRRPPRYKDLTTTGAVPLPAVGSQPVMSVAQAMQQRRSRREFADRALTAEELAWMVHAATGITSDDERRTAPSAGALYPIETYVAVNRVEGIEPGLYHVDVRAMALQPIRLGSVGGDLLIAGLGQDFLRRAPAVFVLSGSFQRTRWKYRERHYRYVCWEAGHVAQNLYLAGEASGLGVCVVGAFLDGVLNDLLRIDGREEAALGFVAVGVRRTGHEAQPPPLGRAGTADPGAAARSPSH